MENSNLKDRPVNCLNLSNQQLWSDVIVAPFLFSKHMFASITPPIIEEVIIMFIIGNVITLIFEIFMFILLWIGLIGFIVHGDKPKWFTVIFDLFFKIEDSGD